MIALLQRVTRASVTVDDSCIARIGQGLLVFLGVEKQDNPELAEKLCHKVLNYRVFADESGKMNDSLLQVGGQLLLVPQFTLAAATDKGLRPGFSQAAAPQKGIALFEQVIDIMRRQGEESPCNMPEHWLQCGRFGADMAVALVNDGPVTFHLQV